MNGRVREVNPLVLENERLSHEVEAIKVMNKRQAETIGRYQDLIKEIKELIEFKVRYLAAVIPTSTALQLKYRLFMVEEWQMLLALLPPSGVLPLPQYRPPSKGCGCPGDPAKKEEAEGEDSYRL